MGGRSSLAGTYILIFNLYSDFLISWCINLRQQLRNLCCDRWNRAQCFSDCNLLRWFRHKLQSEKHLSKLQSLFPEAGGRRGLRSCISNKFSGMLMLQVPEYTGTCPSTSLLPPSTCLTYEQIFLLWWTFYCNNHFQKRRRDVLSHGSLHHCPGKHNRW